MIEKNKKLNAAEKKKLELLIARDTVNVYLTSTNGYWYFYQKKDSLASLTPKTNDQIEIEFDIRNLQNELVYKKQKRFYTVDKEDFIPALQDGVKRMKIGETVTFLIPSYSAFGVVGDGNKIGVNESLISTVTLHNINIKK
ncbi:FKBP-type peptidyl-prolyl cis-trans isomerase [Tenacibaculum sp. SG-28]|uniref:FKBP-type peptidyl-prolyl cis-trans isomerase n=1 Tax=Tenacibaculum sp. SG-28 TaxID=754426 RepID=UPI00130480B6|nr:FKBP-type peptidyl-prolyl cis-trans isomerase [Tenacibaculum sp. SG-28]